MKRNPSFKELSVRSQKRPLCVATTLVILTALIATLLAHFVAPVLIEIWGFVPARLSTAASQRDTITELLRGVSALFVHLNAVHLLGNLVFCWLFGIRVERALGASWFLALFVLSGVLGNLIVAWQAPDLQAPIIGASGAVSGIMGAFLVAHPRRPVGVVLPLGLYWQVIQIPAQILIGGWFLLQLMYTIADAGLDVVAWWAHIGGFLFGATVAFVLRRTRAVRWDSNDASIKSYF